jgi:hypothetical protein
MIGGWTPSLGPYLINSGAINIGEEVAYSLFVDMPSKVV